MAVAKTVSCCPQTDSKSPVPKVTPIQLIKKGQSSPLCTSVFGIGRCSECYQRRNANTKSVIKPLIYSDVLPAKFAGAVVAQSVWEQPNNI